jgi:hypothetical protein
MSFVCVMEIAIITDKTAIKTAEKAISKTVSHVINAWLPVVGAGKRA